MNALFRVITFVCIWGAVILSTIWVFQKWGTMAGIIYFLFGAGIAGALGGAVAASIAKMFGVPLE